MTTAGLLIFGASGFAREVGAWAANQRELLGFIDETNNGFDLRGRPVLSLDGAVARFPDAEFIVCVGDPALRETLTRRAQAAGLVLSSPLIHPTVQADWSYIAIGAGTVICGGTHLTTDIRIGDGVQINLDCTVGHDAVLDDYATFAPGVHVSGKVHIGARVYVGTGAVFVDGDYGDPLRVGDGAVVGAGAVVAKNVPPGETWVGVPARPIQR